MVTLRRRRLVALQQKERAGHLIERMIWNELPLPSRVAAERTARFFDDAKVLVDTALAERVHARQGVRVG